MLMSQLIIYTRNVLEREIVDNALLTTAEDIEPVNTECQMTFSDPPESTHTSYFKQLIVDSINEKKNRICN